MSGQLDRWLLPQQELRFHLGLLRGIVQVGHVVLAPRKEGSELVKLLPFPLVERVVVTLGALDADPHEQPGGLRCQQRWLVLIGQHEVVLSRLLAPVVLVLLLFLVADRHSRDQLGDDRIPGGPFFELPGQPVFQSFWVGTVSVRRGLEEDHVLPVPRPFSGVRLGRQKLVDQPRAFRGRGVGDEFADFGTRRRAADEVEVHAANESFVVDQRGIGPVATNAVFQRTVEVQRGVANIAAGPADGHRVTDDRQELLFVGGSLQRWQLRLLCCRFLFTGLFGGLSGGGPPFPGFLGLGVGSGYDDGQQRAERQDQQTTHAGISLEKSDA